MDKLIGQMINQGMEFSMSKTDNELIRAICVLLFLINQKKISLTEIIGKGYEQLIREKEILKVNIHIEEIVKFIGKLYLQGDFASCVLK